VVNRNTEHVELDLSDVEQIWGLLDQGLRPLAISKKTGLPVPLVKAVIFGRYSLKGDKAIVDMPAMPMRRVPPKQCTAVESA